MKKTLQMVERVNMKIKYLCIFILLILMTGCNATYTLYIDEDFREEITVSPENSKESETIKNFDFAYPAYYDSEGFNEFGDEVEGLDYYKYDHSDLLTASYTFGKNYYKSKAANYCYPSFDITKGKNVVIKTDTTFNCFDYEPLLNKVTIKLVTNNPVIKHNADEVNGKIYTWNIDKNGSLKPIYFEYENPDYNEEKIKAEDILDKNKEKKDEDEKEKKSASYGLILLLCCLFFVGLFVIIFFKDKLRKE